MTQLTSARRSRIQQIAGLPAAHVCSTTSAALERKLEKLQFPNPQNLAEWSQFQAQAIHMVREYLPASVINLLARFTQDPRQPGFVISGLPVGKLPSTPTDGRRPADKSAVSEAVKLGILYFQGDLISFSEEKAGMPIHEVAPKPGEEATQSNAGRNEFRKHTDNAFLGPFNLDGILLLGLRNPHRVATSVLTLDDILSATPLDLQRALRREAYCRPSPHSFGFNPTYYTNPMPLLWTSNGIDYIAMPSADIKAIDAEADGAQREFRRLVESLPARKVILEPGTMLGFRNARVLHGRDAFTGDRWVQRAFWKSSVAQLRQLTNSDPRQYAFSAAQLLKSF